MESTSPFTITKEQANSLAESVRAGRKLLFTNMANRNWVAKICKQKHIEARKSSVRNQLLDPRYTVEGSNIPDQGLGNDYKHYHSVLYCLEPDSYNRW